MVRGKLHEMLTTPEAVVQWGHAPLQHSPKSAVVQGSHDLMALDSAAYRTVLCHIFLRHDKECDTPVV